ncbi:MAG: tripartite tricarboxylate transporter substrate binding protein [Betaproteobacteria bacterium]|nr:tripartite tricarboxylate transporter substrate binding protein [Betaproteobacteria bacterium]
MKHCKVVFCLMTAFAAAPLHAQSYPVKPVKIMSVFPTGLSPDIYLRVVADKLSRYWGQPVIVEARPGGNGFVAIGALKNAQPDGHELLLVGNNNLTLNPLLLKAPPNDVEKELVPITTLAYAPFFLYVAAKSPYRNVQDLIAAARQSPEKVSYSSNYIGSPPHMGGAMLAQMTGTQMLAIHFKEGSQLYSSVANGDITFTVTTSGGAVPLIKSGHLRTLASASLKRNADAPDVPTVDESLGVSGYEVDAWVCLTAPRATPMDIVNRIAADVARAMAEPDVREKYKSLGVQPASTTPQELATRIRGALKKNADLIQRIGLKPE